MRDTTARPVMAAPVRSDDLEWLLESERALSRSAQDADAVQSITSALAGRLGCWAMLLDRHARVRVAAGRAPDGPGTVARQPVAELVGDLAARRGPSVAIGQLPCGDQRDAVVAYPCGPDAVLAAGRPTPFTAGDRAVMTSALRLLDLAERERAAGAVAAGAAVVALLAGSGPETEAGALLSVAPAEPVRAVVGVPTRRARPDRVIEQIWWARHLDSPLVRLDRDGAHAVTARPLDDRDLDDFAGRGWALAISSPVPVRQVASALREAAALATRVRVSRRHLRGEDAAASTAALVDPALAADFARRRLRPVVELPPERSRELLTTLRAWLAAHGGWDASARALGLHRNTVRRLIGQLEALLQADLSDPQVRADLWLALAWLD